MVTSNFPRWPGDSTTPFVLHLAVDLQRLGWLVDVVAPHAPGAATRDVLDGVSVERFRYIWPESLETLCYGGGALINLRKNRSNLLKVPFFALAELSKVAQRLAFDDYDIVHSHWIVPQGFIVGLCARPLRVAHVLTVHGGDAFAFRGRLSTWLKRIALRTADAVTVNSSATLGAVSNIANDLAHVHKIPIGASEGVVPDAAAVSQIRSCYRRGDGPLLAFVGRIVEEKGVGDLLRAVNLSVARLPAITAVIVGDGQDRARMEALAGELGLQQRVTFTGWVPSSEVPGYLAAADIFVGPSKLAADGWIEAQGLTFAEAMLADTPVIATRTGGVIDLVRHEETGLLVSEGAPDEIASAIERLVADQPLAARVRKGGYSLAAGQFTRAASAQAFSALFESLLVQKESIRDRPEHR